MKFIKIDYSYSKDLEINSIPSVLVATRVPNDKNGNPRYEIKLFTALLDGSIVAYEACKKVTSYNIQSTLNDIASQIEDEGVEQTY